MACGPKPIALSLTDGEQTGLPRPGRWRRTGQDVATHARIPLLCANSDVTSTAIAARLGPGRQSVVTWWQRLPAQLGKGLSDVMRGGALRRVGDIAIERLVAPTLEAQAEGAVHWSMRWPTRRPEPGHDLADLAGVRMAAAPDRELQPAARTGHRGQGAQRDQVLPRTPGRCPGLVRGQGAAGPSGRRHKAGPADAPGTARATQPR